MTSEWFLFTLLKIYTSPKTNFWLRPCVSFPKYYNDLLQTKVGNKLATFQSMGKLREKVCNGDWALGIRLNYIRGSYRHGDVALMPGASPSQVQWRF